MAMLATFFTCEREQNVTVLGWVNDQMRGKQFQKGVFRAPGIRLVIIISFCCAAFRLDCSIRVIIGDRALPPGGHFQLLLNLPNLPLLPKTSGSCDIRHYSSSFSSCAKTVHQLRRDSTRSPHSKL